MEKPKRKTYTSSAVKKRWNNKTYTRFTFSLRKVEDAEIIEIINREKENSSGTTEAIKRLILRGIKK